MSARRRIAEAQVAVMLLTRLPAGRLRDPVPTLAEAQWAYPLVGLPVGLLCWLVLAGALWAGLPEPVAAMLFLVANAMVTGALHHDGLADFADSIGGGRDRAHCLEIMRDSRIGSYGALALILALGCQATALVSMDASLSVVQVLSITVTSRLAMLVVMQFAPAARRDGLGHSAGGQSVAVLPVGAVAGLLLLLATGSGASSFAMVIASMAGLAVVLRLAWRRLGGYTGDVLGAVLMTFETICYVVLSAWAA
ncbi:cobalamin-5'-phosphate synthase [Roseivivax marinus]|uniref:adenosylcobinamide-GDP ribazoletransferase n=1 Tax=Roseivivax marinus TaxID=1379903 RepID=UPI0008BB1872|nr:adenosylcobinamide-GDP ribazoletransferase [Roseivivax marinus]SEL88359.1 cobalamin-5'-phosphate synthase [Roseivivax marinus]